MNDKEKNEVSDFGSEQKYNDTYKKAIRFSVFCIGLLVALCVLFALVFNNDTDLYKYELSIFDRVEPHGVVVNNMCDKISTENIDIVIEHFSFENDDITIIVYGENKLDNDWTADNEDFVLSVFNCGEEKAYDARQRFYAYDFEGHSVQSGQHFLYILNFNVPNLDNRLSSGSLFALTLFQNEGIDTHEVKLDFANPDACYTNDEIPLEDFEVLLKDCCTNLSISDAVI